MSVCFAAEEAFNAELRERFKSPRGLNVHL